MSQRQVLEHFIQSDDRISLTEYQIALAAKKAAAKAPIQIGTGKDAYWANPTPANIEKARQVAASEAKAKEIADALKASKSSVVQKNDDSSQLSIVKLR